MIVTVVFHLKKKMEIRIQNPSKGLMLGTSLAACKDTMLTDCEHKEAAVCTKQASIHAAQNSQGYGHWTIR